MEILPELREHQQCRDPNRDEHKRLVAIRSFKLSILLTVNETMIDVIEIKVDT